MANWYSLDGDANGSAYRILFLIPIPSSNNSVGVNFQTALVNSGLGGTLPPGVSSGNAPGQVSAADAALITSGAAYPVIEPFLPTGIAPANLGAAVDVRLAQLTTQWQAILGNRLKFYGASGT